MTTADRTDIAENLRAAHAFITQVAMRDDHSAKFRDAWCATADWLEALADDWPRIQAVLDVLSEDDLRDAINAVEVCSRLMGPALQPQKARELIAHLTTAADAVRAYRETRDA